MTDLNRRKITQYIGLGTVFSVPLAAVTSVLSRTASAALVDPSSAPAQALQYTATSTTDGAACGLCALYQGAEAEQGPCPLFTGQEVSAAGWCSAFVLKP